MRKLLAAVVSLLMIQSPMSFAQAIPPLPSKAQWEANMLNFGRQACERQRTANAAYKAGTGPVDSTLSYYDGEGVFLSIWQYTSDTYWRDCAQIVEQGYRGMPPAMSPANTAYPHGYVFGNNGGTPGYWGFTEGLKDDFMLLGDVDSKTAVFLLSERMAYSTDGTNLSWTWAADLSREVAYGTRNMLNAEALGHAHRTRMDAFIEQILAPGPAVAPPAGCATCPVGPLGGHLRQWLDHTYRAPNPFNLVPAAAGNYYIQPFMIGLTARAAIAIWNYNHDSRVYPLMVELGNFLHQPQFWDPIKKAWVYETYAATYEQLPTPVVGSPDLNMLILPLYGWLYSQDHNAQWITWADEAFQGGVAGAYLAADKQFNQNYTWSFDYLKWRNDIAIPGVPSAPIINLEVIS